MGIATGLLVTAAHHAGLATLTHTPSSLMFLSKELRRPENEQPYLLITMGFAAEGCQVPLRTRKRLDQVLVVHK